MMNSHVSTVAPESPLGELPETVLRERHTAFPVVDGDGHVLGAVSLDDARGKEPTTVVGSVMHKVAKVSEDADAADALRAMSGNGLGGVVVTDREGLIRGIITKTDLIRAMQLRQFGPEMTAEA